MIESNKWRHKQSDNTSFYMIKDTNHTWKSDIKNSHLPFCLQAEMICITVTSRQKVKIRDRCGVIWIYRCRPMWDTRGGSKLRVTWAYLTVDLKVRNSKVKFKIDNGADVKVIPEQVYRQLYNSALCNLAPGNKELFGPGCTPLSMVGVARENLQCGKKYTTKVIYMVKHLNTALLSSHGRQHRYGLCEAKLS